MPEEKEVGKITHYYTNLGVGVIELSDNLNKGDEIHVKGTTTDFEQTIDEMQISGNIVETAKKGDAIGLKVDERVREGDIVYKNA